MRRLTATFVLSLLVGWSGAPCAAEDGRDSATESLLERLEQLEQVIARQQETILELQRLVAQANIATGPVVENSAAEAEGVEEPADLEAQLAAELGTDQANPDEQAQSSTSPAALTVVSSSSGKNYMQISLDGLMAVGASSDPDVPNLELGSHDPSRRGFTVQNVELVLNGAVDPYFTGQASIVFVEQPDGETETELEELYVTTSSLPHNLQAKAGHFFTAFGRLNAQHPHTWDFADQPLVSARMFGSDGLRSSGARVSWLMPLPFYSELLLTIQNAFGETLTSFGLTEGAEIFGRTLADPSVRSSGDLLYVPRYTASVDPTANQTVLFGASAALGPNGTGDDGRTSIYGADIFWKWKSARAIQGFPFVKVQAEGMQRRYRADDPMETFEDWGAYVQALWGYKRGWVAGVRYDAMGGDDGGAVSDPFLEDRRRSSVNLSWFPTEYSKLRLQYNHDNRSFFADADSLWLQFEFILGAHAAHKF